MNCSDPVSTKKDNDGTFLLYNKILISIAKIILIKVIFCSGPGLCY